MSELEPWEIVHTVNDFFDFPRLGVADFRGVPHVYACVFDAALDDWTSTYRLSPIDRADLAAVQEAWEIWSRWQSSFHAKTLTAADHHPSLARDRARHEELEPVVARRLNAEGGFLARGEFRGSMFPLAMHVCWSDL